MPAGVPVPNDHLGRVVDVLPDLVQKLGPGDDVVRAGGPQVGVQVRPLHQRMDGPTKMEGKRMRLDTEEGNRLRRRREFANLRGKLGLVLRRLFLRGHDAPGGGFVAGLVMSVGLLLQYIVSGTEWVEERIRLRPRGLAGLGMLLAVGTASAPFLVDYPLLTSHTFHLRLPVLGEVHVASALFFDLGVFCIVLGSVLLILVALAHQSIRAHRASGGG